MRTMGGAARAISLATTISEQRAEKETATHQPAQPNDVAAAVFGLQHLAEDLLEIRRYIGTSRPWALSEPQMEEVEARLAAICARLRRARRHVRRPF